MIEDAELLRRYAMDRSEAAFAELVRRRVDLIYAVARRQCGGDTHLAEEVTQRVFADLARKARTLAGRTVISGWLYRSAQFAASDAVRAERRRRAREQEDFLMKETTTGPSGGHSGEEAGMETLRPLLDAALVELSEADRDAVALRFFEERPWAEVAGALGLKEDAARKRVARALDSLQGLLARRGITSTAAALGGALGGQSGVAAPAGLAANVTGLALAAGTAAPTAGAIGGGVLTFMSTGKIVLAGVVVIAGFGAAFVAAGTAREAEVALATATATARQAALNAKLGELESRVQTQTKRAQEAELKNGRLLSAAQKMKVAPGAAVVSAPENITSDMVSARFKRAQELVRTGDPAEALRELLWCYDIGMAQIRSMVGVRFSYALDAFVTLAERYPPARTALLERQEQARKALLESGQDFNAAGAFGAISRVLKDGGAAFAILDQLPPGDSRRIPLAGALFDDLLAARRYSVALEGRPYGQLSSMLERSIERPNHDPWIKEHVKSIEVLAGAGDLARARSLAERLLALDGSEHTRALIQQHATRAGHPGLLAPLAR